MPAVNILCGHYEGVDARAIEAHIDMEISLGDYVLTGGELAAMVLIDTFIRHVDGVLGNEESADKRIVFRRAARASAVYCDRRSLRAGRCRKCCFPVIMSKWRNITGGWRSMKQRWRRPDLLSKVVLSAKDIEYITKK